MVNQILLSEKSNSKLTKIDSLEFIVGTNLKYKAYVLKDMKDIYNWGKALKNCLDKDECEYKNKVVAGDLFLIGIYKREKPYAVLSINKKGKILEIKKKANEKLNESEEDYIINKIRKKYLS